MGLTEPGPVDWRQTDWGVGDQGNTGTCVGWAVGDGVLRWIFTRSKILSKQERVSPWFLWLGAVALENGVASLDPWPSPHFSAQMGTCIETALKVASMLGCLREPLAGPAWHGPDLPPGAPPVGSLQIHQLAVKPLAIDVLWWKRWLVKEGPLAIRINADVSFMGLEDGRDRLVEYRPYPDPENRGHAVAFVGFRENGDFILRNSWGTGWGDNGHAYAAPSYLRHAVTEAWGVRSTLS